MARRRRVRTARHMKRTAWALAFALAFAIATTLLISVLATRVAA